MKAGGVRATKVSDGTVRLEGRVTKSFRRQAGDRTADAVQRAIDSKKPLNTTAIKSLFADTQNKAMAQSIENFAKKQAGSKGQMMGLGDRMSVKNPALGGKKSEMRDSDLNGMTAEQFKHYETKSKSMSDEELKFALKDLHETIKIQEDMHKFGGNTPKLGFYWDEMHTYMKEVLHREKKASALGGKKSKMEAKEIKTIDLLADQKDMEEIKKLGIPEGVAMDYIKLARDVGEKVDLGFVKASWRQIQEVRAKQAAQEKYQKEVSGKTDLLGILSFITQEDNA